MLIVPVPTMTFDDIKNCHRVEDFDFDFKLASTSSRTMNHDIQYCTVYWTDRDTTIPYSVTITTRYSS
jgi:hypothetical protein